MTQKTKRARAYNSSRARDLVTRANALLALAGGTASAAGAAFLGSGGTLYPLHYTLLGVTGSLTGMAMLLLKAAQRAEIKSGKAGLQRVSYTVPRWDGNQRPARNPGYVPPQLPAHPAAATVVLPALPPGMPAQPPLARPAAAAPAPQPVPVAEHLEQPRAAAAQPRPAVDVDPQDQAYVVS